MLTKKDLYNLTRFYTNEDKVFLRVYDYHFRYDMTKLHCSLSCISTLVMKGFRRAL